MVIALLPLGCDTQDGPEWDIPVRSQPQTVQFEVDANGSPMVLADVAMNYGTKARLEEYDQKYRTLNVQAVLYSPMNGAWDGRGFRNLQAYYGQSQLVRDAEGGLRVAVWNRDRLIVYARSGADWTAKTAGTLPEPLREYGFSSRFPGGGVNMALMGDSGWQCVSQDYNHPQSMVVSNTGARIILDSNQQWTPLAFFPGKSVNRLLATVPAADSIGKDSLQRFRSNLVCYSWNLDRGDSSVRKQWIDTSGAFFSVDPYSVAGEARFHAYSGSDSLVDFALRGNDFVRIGRIDLVMKDTAGVDSAYRFRGGAAGPDGCLHSLAVYGPDPSSPEGYLYGSSCRTGTDSLKFPPETRIPGVGAGTPIMRFAGDGSPMILFEFEKRSGPIYKEDGSFQAGDDFPGPAWIYLARLRGAKWEWEQVAAY